MANNVQLDFLTNAKQLRGELYQVNAYLHNIEISLDKMNAKAVTGHRAHGGALKGLALRFVGYQLILGQVMNAQRKLYDYVTEGVSKFREFETRLAEVSTIMGEDFRDALIGMQAGIETLALRFGQNTSDLTKGLYDIMSAAFSAKDAIALLNTATKASIAGLSDVRTSVDIFTTILRTYGMEVYEATRVSDILFQSVVRGKFQFGELESALGYVVPIAAQAGIAFDELMAALSTATRHGLHLDMASRGLAMALQNIINPSEGAAKAAEKYQIELSGLALRVKGIAGVFGEMNQKTKEYGKIVLNELIPNIRSLRVAMVLAGEEGLEGLMDDMEMLAVSAGRTEQALNKIRDTSQFASNQITQQWEKTQRTVGKAWDEFALGVQRGITDVAANWQAFLPVIGPFFTMEKFDEEKRFDKWVSSVEEKFMNIKRITHIPGAKWQIIPRDDLEIMQDYLELQKEIARISESIGTRIRRGEDYKDLERQLMALHTISAQLGEEFNRAFGEPIIGGIRNLEALKLTLEEIEFDTEKLVEHLEKPIEYGWAKGPTGEIVPAGVIKGTLNFKRAQKFAEQELADVQYDVKMGLEDQNYAYKVLNGEMQEAIRVVREHTKATQEDKVATDLMNMALRRLQIEMLEIQLIGLSRRRGLTRAEEKRMKQIQIEQLKLRIENMKQTKQELEADYFLYNEKKKMIDDYVRSKEHETYMLKYNFDQQVADIDTTIAYERNLLEERKTQWQETNEELTKLASQLIEDLTAIWSSPKLTDAFEAIDINIAEMIDSVRGAIGEVSNLAETTKKETTPAVAGGGFAGVEAFGFPTGVGGGAAEAAQSKKVAEWIARIPPAIVTMFRNAGHSDLDIAKRYAPFGTFQRGAEFIYQTGLAMVHQGETISPAGREEVGGTVIIENLTIDVQEIAEIGSVEKLGALLSSARNSGILDKSGRTNFRLRVG